MKSYQQSVDEVLTAFDTGRAGLSEGQARVRLKRYGSNELKTEKPVSAWRKFLAQFQDIDRQKTDHPKSAAIPLQARKYRSQNDTLTGPSLVSWRPLPTWRKSLWPTLFSSVLICAEIVGCDRRSSFAAAVIDPVFATVQKYSKW